MSNKRVSRGGFVNPSRLARGPNGRALCRRCKTEVPKGRRTFCGNECVHEHRLRTDPAYLRSQVFKRDGGVCSACDLDTTKIDRILKHARRGEDYRFTIDRKFNIYDFIKAWGFAGASHWQADHIIPVVEGGGECGLENLRTLCSPCHKQVTKELRQRLKQQRKANQPQQNLF